MDNNVYIFLRITLVTSLYIADLTPNFSESNYIYPNYKWYKLFNEHVLITPSIFLFLTIKYPHFHL